MVLDKSHFLILLQGSGAREKLLLVHFLVISDSDIRTCLHLCSRFVGEERGVHTQVKQSLFPGLPYLAFHHLQCGQKAEWELGSNGLGHVV